MKHFGLMTATVAVVPLAVPFFGMTLMAPEAAPSSSLPINSTAAKTPGAKGGQSLSAPLPTRPFSKDLPVFTSNNVSVPRSHADIAIAWPSSGSPASTNQLSGNSGAHSGPIDQSSGIQAQALWGQSSGERAATLRRHRMLGE